MPSLSLADGPALVILSLVCANIRNCVRPASVLRALEILLALNRYLTDETRLDRLVPYLVSLLEDDIATVRSVALRALTQTLVLVRGITPSNVDVFPEYILPNTRPFSTDPEVLPREMYALCIAALAETAQRFLEMAEAMRGEGAFELQGLQQDFEGSPYAVRLLLLLRCVSLAAQRRPADALSPRAGQLRHPASRAARPHPGPRQPALVRPVVGRQARPPRPRWQLVHLLRPPARQRRRPRPPRHVPQHARLAPSGGMERACGRRRELRRCKEPRRVHPAAHLAQPRRCVPRSHPSLPCPCDSS